MRKRSMMPVMVMILRRHLVCGYALGLNCVDAAWSHGATNCSMWMRLSSERKKNSCMRWDWPMISISVSHCTAIIFKVLASITNDQFSLMIRYMFSLIYNILSTKEPLKGGVWFAAVSRLTLWNCVTLVSMQFYCNLGLNSSHLHCIGGGSTEALVCCLFQSLLCSRTIPYLRCE